MSYIFAFFVSVLLYLGGGWCINNIYLSIFPIKDSATLHDIACTELKVYAFWAILVNVVALTLADKQGANIKDSDIPIAIFVPIALCFISVFIPMSLGFGIINLIICIGLMTYCVGQWFDRL